MLYIIGIGPGNISFLTEEGLRLLKSIPVVMGHCRHAKDLLPLRSDVLEYTTLEELKEYIMELKGTDVAVVASGDPKLYGIADYLSRFAAEQSLESTIISGISSIQYLFSRLSLSMNDLYISSSHGKMPDFDFILLHTKVAMVTDQETGPYAMAQEVLKRNTKHYLVVGENLSYAKERIRIFEPEEITSDMVFDFNVTILTEEKPYER